MTTKQCGVWQQFICQACGYAYEKTKGDVYDSLPTDTAFQAIASDWQCPACGASKGDLILHQAPTDTKSNTTNHRTQAGIVIIGAGMAGWSVVDAVRAIDQDIAITLITADDADRYHKPMLSTAISGQKTPRQLVRNTGADAASTANIRLLSNTLVQHIDSQSWCVHTTHGTVDYDHLVLAIGANPIYPPNINHNMAWHINHLHSFATLQARLLTTKKHIAIIGAGMVGTEFSEDLINAGHTVSLVDVNPYPLSTLLPKIAGERILTAITELGVNFMGNTTIQTVHHTTDGHALQLLDSTSNQAHTLMVDEIVIATGLAVDARLLMTTGITFHQRTGIMVDEKTLQTSVPHIYAIGDCISIRGVPCRYVAPHRAQAAAIASHILHGTGNYEHKPPMIRLKNKCIAVTANGLPTAHGDWHIINDSPHELSLAMHQDGQTIATALLKTPPKPTHTNPT